MKMERKLRQASQTTIFPELRWIISGFMNGQASPPGNCTKNHTEAHTQLGCGDSAAAASPSPPMGKGIGQSFHQQAHLGQLWILHRAGGFAQSRVTQLNDGSDGHGQFSMVCDRRIALAGF
jgi:hypothetical protein